MKPHYRILRVGNSRVAPFKTESLKEAETEALRLAGIEPGEAFEIYQCLAIAQTAQPSLFWLDTIGTPAPGKGQEGWDPRPEPTAAEHYPATPLPEGFDRWVCRGEAWPIPADAVWCSRWTEASGRSAASWEQEAIVGPKGRGWYDGERADLEYWEAVKDEPSYRMLELWEQVLPGDEFKTYDGDWVPTIYGTSDPFIINTDCLGRYRRPIKKP